MMSASNDNQNHETNAPTPTPVSRTLTRRDFVKATAATGAAMSLSGIATGAWAWPGGSDVLRVGVIGCGGRGTGAAFDSLKASDRVRVVALADLFEDRLRGCLNQLSSNHPDRATIAAHHQYVGFDAYKRLIAESDVDVVILATPPHFRPMMFEEATKNGKHVFMEKPVAVDPAGIRRVLAAADESERKGLSVVAGTQRRHEDNYLAAMEQVNQGVIGDVVSAHVYWNQGGLWVKHQQPEWSDMEWQARNWLYFTWLSGDHIVEQHVHNLDVANWVMGSHPTQCVGMGGRQSRTAPEYGNIFDHFAIQYDYPDGRFVLSMCRQADGATPRVEEVICGSEGRMTLRPNFGVAETYGEDTKTLWRAGRDKVSPYVQEHIDLIASIDSKSGLNEARRVAESTLTAIMGRMSAYTGQHMTWEQALNSELDLSPENGYQFGNVPMRPVAIPGKTPLV